MKNDQNNHIQMHMMVIVWNIPALIILNIEHILGTQFAFLFNINHSASPIYCWPLVFCFEHKLKAFVHLIYFSYPLWNNTHLSSWYIYSYRCTYNAANVNVLSFCNIFEQPDTENLDAPMQCIVDQGNQANGIVKSWTLSLHFEL